MPSLFSPNFATYAMSSVAQNDGTRSATVAVSLLWSRRADRGSSAFTGLMYGDTIRNYRSRFFRDAVGLRRGMPECACFPS